MKRIIAQATARSVQSQMEWRFLQFLVQMLPYFQRGNSDSSSDG